MLLSSHGHPATQIQSERVHEVNYRKKLKAAMHFFDWDLIKENKTCYPSLACGSVCQEWEQIIYSFILTKIVVSKQFKNIYV